MRNLVLWLVLGAVIVTANLLIMDKEQILAEGDTILLQLAPRDPRSLLQGDYITLRYALARRITESEIRQVSADGRIVVAVDGNQVARFARFDDGTQPLAGNEKYLAYRKRGENVRVASDAFFFQEGDDDLYRDARYGELKVDADGDAVLVGVRDADFRRLGPISTQDWPQ
jgi:uncharacterized membrane-anchored protein